MPYLAAIQQEYGDRHIRTLAINAKEDADKVGAEDPRTYMERNKYGLVTVLNGDAIARAYAVEYMGGSSARGNGDFWSTMSSSG